MARCSTMSWGGFRVRRRAMRTVLAGGIVAACLAFVIPTRAADRPWATGIDGAAEADARRHFDEGVGFLKDAFFTRAVQSFEDSLARWDHPGTHFNLAKAYMTLDQSVRALHHLWAAMRHGGHPLALEHVEQIERYAVLLLEEVSLVSITTERTGSVSLNGAHLFEGPGTWSGIVRPDKHTIDITGGAKGKTAFTAVARRRVEVRFGPTGGAVTAMRNVEKPDLEPVQMAKLGFVVRFPAAEQRKAWRPRKGPATPSWTDPGDALPGQAGEVCPGAKESVASGRKQARDKADLAQVCEDFERVWRDYVRLQRESQRRHDEAIRRLQEMTAGGIVEGLE